jgi:hypothetical protein
MAINYHKQMLCCIEENKIKKELPKLLLHACCAPCSSHSISILREGFDITIFYFNPNIDDFAEYQLRKNEQQKLEEWAKNYPNTISIAGKYNIQEELQILQQCDALLSMDSSNMHFASLVKTPAVSIWGATHPFAGFYGYQQDPEDAVQLDLACRPCSIYGNKPCLKGNYPCLNNIDNKVIISKLNKYI